MKPFKHLALAAALLLPFSAAALTDEEITQLNKTYDLPTGKMLGNSCSACHGTLGAEFNEGMPSLAGMDKQEFIAQMQAFKNNDFPTIVMHDVAYVYSDEEIELMAEYFAQQPAEQWPHLNSDGTVKQIQAK